MAKNKSTNINGNLHTDNALMREQAKFPNDIPTNDGNGWILTCLDGDARKGLGAYKIGDFVNKFMKSVFLDLFYPVNTLYLTDDQNFNPNTAWGGTWEQLDGGYALMSTKKNNAWNSTTKKREGAVCFEMSTLFADNHTPGTNSVGGIPNITGSFEFTDDNGGSNYWVRAKYGDGAFYTGRKGSGNFVNSDGTHSGNYDKAIYMDASKCAGNYGRYQQDAPQDNMRIVPDHHSCIVWKRTK